MSQYEFHLQSHSNLIIHPSQLKFIHKQHSLLVHLRQSVLLWALLYIIKKNFWLINFSSINHFPDKRYQKHRELLMSRQYPTSCQYNVSFWMSTVNMIVALLQLTSMQQCICVYKWYIVHKWNNKLHSFVKNVFFLNQ